jgi:predicted DNA-binding transcriptional regulator AlpA
MTTVLSSVDTEELGTIIAAKIQNYFAQANSRKQQQKLLSINDVCAVFGITRPTVTSWSAAGILQEHRIGRRIYYKQEEIDAALAKIKRIKVA